MLFGVCSCRSTGPHHSSADSLGLQSAYPLALKWNSTLQESAGAAALQHVVRPYSCIHRR